MDISDGSDVIKENNPVGDSVLLLCENNELKPSTFICDEDINGRELGWIRYAQNDCTQTL